jgi:TrmH family RNA methyltransferase
MSADTVIRSRANPLIKRAGAALAGREPGTLVLEGERLVEDALRSGLPIELLLVADARPELAARLSPEVPSLRLVDAELLQKVSGLRTSPGVLALCSRPPAQSIDAWRRDARSLYLVVAGVADPGNLGALARSAEALGAQAMIALAGASPWSPKALRGSMGSLLRLPVSYGLTADEAAEHLSALGVRQVRAATRDGADPWRLDWSGPLALWVGGETGALPDAAEGFEPVSIPMAGRSESLNVTVATALLLYASGRVRPGGGAPGGDAAGDARGDAPGDPRGRAQRG